MKSRFDLNHGERSVPVPACRQTGADRQAQGGVERRKRSAFEEW